MDFEEIVIDDCNTLIDRINTYVRETRWIFRGQKNFNWGLKTSMDRMLEGVPINSSKMEIEIALIKRFQRESYHYSLTDIDYLNIPEWLSLMQHYGVSTRLLDWTHSPWVALFFAIIDLTKDVERAALWLLDWNHLDSIIKSEVRELSKRDHNLIDINDFIVAVNSGDGIIKFNSFRQNQRQIIQQGTFVFPTNVEKTFEQNMAGIIGKSNLKKVIIPFDLKKPLIQMLYRMNISYATLYPGIEGFSKSLNYLPYIDGILKLEELVRDYEGYKNKFRNNRD